MGTAVGAGPPPVDGAVVAGTAVGAGVDVAAAGTGVAVADDPQANNRAKNNRTIALGRCLVIRGLDLDIWCVSLYVFSDFRPADSIL